MSMDNERSRVAALAAAGFFLLVLAGVAAAGVFAFTTSADAPSRGTSASLHAGGSGAQGAEEPSPRTPCEFSGEENLVDLPRAYVDEAKAAFEEFLPGAGYLEPQSARFLEDAGWSDYLYSFHVQLEGDYTTYLGVCNAHDGTVGIKREDYAGDLAGAGGAAPLRCALSDVEALGSVVPADFAARVGPEFADWCADLGWKGRSHVALDGVGKSGGAYVMELEAYEVFKGGGAPHSVRATYAVADGALVFEEAA